MQRVPRSRVIVPGGRIPGASRACGYEPQPRDATPYSASRTVSRNARRRAGMIRNIVDGITTVNMYYTQGLYMAAHPSRAHRGREPRMLQADALAVHRESAASASARYYALSP